MRIFIYKKYLFNYLVIFAYDSPHTKNELFDIL